MPKLPRASGDRHVSAFKAAGWQVNHIEGSHYILIKNDSEIHLSIPVHKNTTLGVGLLKKLINKAGLTNEEYLEYFYGK
ncbi:MAG: putative RNA binding protein YcfA, dsRBD-like fold, HicA-like mRNA interferase family [Candidatus Methanocomedens sp.]|nr:MAG: putative RNA binding protein YcfA, dsRBD-like fold, HicA-like mRNA interferase family [ANME-2 cluster archaeon]